MPALDLRLDDDELSTCVACGLCLPHCPTFRATGEEALSPRGRIDAMRGVQWRGADADDDFVRFMETCVQCRGCEPACPSGVPFGRLMEGTRSALVDQDRSAPRWLRAALGVLGRHRLLLVGSRALALAQRLRLVPRRLGLGRLPLRQGRRVRATGTGVWLFTGCVMDAWLRETHRATATVVAATGTTYAVPDAGGACCGALHTHAGLLPAARRLAARVIRSMPGNAAILVNSAGCGAAMKDYGHLLGTTEAAAFAARVVDVHEWLAPRLDTLPAPDRRLGPVIVQDPCHLRHVQKAHLPVRAVLGHVADVVELDDDGLCCGAGGAFSALQPELATQVRDRKLAAIAFAAATTGATIVASANPGCAMHLRAAGLDVRHPLDLVAAAIGKDGP
ncbi:MAG: (Fe-S)-binding protein [Acidimicrobiia bacterium]|nr:(Fe-S)-binding protein [Acidimicrobiia bacterium]